MIQFTQFSKTVKPAGATWPRHIPKDLMLKFIISLFLLVILCVDVGAGDKKKTPKVFVLEKLEPPTLNVTNTKALTTLQKATVTAPDGTNCVEEYEVIFHYSTNAWMDPKSKVPVWYVHTESKLIGSEPDGQVLWCAKEDQPYEVDWEAYSRIVYPRHRPAPLPPQEYFTGYGEGWHPPYAQPVRFAGGASWNHNPYNHAPYWRSYPALRSHYQIGAWGRTGSVRGTGGGVHGSYRSEYNSPTYVRR